MFICDWTNSQLWHILTLVVWHISAQTLYQQLPYFLNADILKMSSFYYFTQTKLGNITLVIIFFFTCCRTATHDSFIRSFVNYFRDESINCLGFKFFEKVKNKPSQFLRAPMWHLQIVWLVWPTVKNSNIQFTVI